MLLHWVLAVCVLLGTPGQLFPFHLLLCAVQTSSGPWDPASASISSPSLRLPTPAIVFIAVGVYLLLLGLVLLTRHCLLVRSLVGKEG